MIAIAVNSFEAFKRQSVMDLQCGFNCFSPELNGSLGVNHHCLGLFSGCTYHSFCNTVPMVGERRAWFVCRTTGRKDILEDLIVVFSPTIIAPESLDPVFN
jgi:hypothetical protein